MWNKYKNQIKELEDKNRRLNDDYQYVNQELERIKLKESQEPQKSVYVCLKNNKTITIYEADDYEISPDHPFVVIYKETVIIASIRKEDITAISNNPISVSDNQYFYTVGGMRI